MRRFAAGLALLSLVGFLIFAASQLPPAMRGAPDFPNYYFGGERVLHGGAVYGSVGPEVEAAFGVEDYPAYPADPPFTVALLSPLALLPYETAWVLLAALSTLLIFDTVYLVARKVGASPEVAAAVAGVALLTTPTRFLLITDHVESVLVPLLALGWLAMQEGRETRGGVFWGLAAALKLFPGLLLVGLFAAGRRKAAWTGVGVAALASVVGMVAVGWDDTVAFVRDVIPASRQWYGTLGNYSLLSFGTALAAPWFGWALTVAIGVPALVLYLRESRRPTELWAAGLALALMLTPLSWLNYLVVLLPVLVVTVAGMSWPQDRYRMAWLIGSLGFWGPVVLGAELPSVLASFVPTFGLFTLFLWTRRRRPVGERTVPAGEWGD